MIFVRKKKPKVDRIGLLIEVNFFPKSQLSMRRVLFRTSVGRLSGRKEGNIFFPSAHVRSLVEAGELSVGQSIGDAYLGIYKDRKLLDFGEFYPLGHIPNRTIELLEGHGLGTVVHAAMVSAAKKLFPKYDIRYPIGTSEKMLDRLGKMRISRGRRYPVEEYYRITRDSLRKMFAKHRKPR